MTKSQYVRYVNMLGREVAHMLALDYAVPLALVQLWDAAC